MCNETAGNSINDDEIRNENGFLIFVVEKNKNWKQTKYNCDGWGRVKPEVVRLQTRWRSSCCEGVFHVFVEPSLGEKLRQQQSKACLYHGRDVFKEMI